MKLLVCGYGNIGKIIYDTLHIKYNDISIYDPAKNYIIEKDEHFDIAYVCVTADTMENGQVDVSNIQNILKIINSDIFVIKSTVPVGTCDRLHDDRIVFSPEFTSTNQHKGIQNFVVLSGNRKVCNKVSEIYKNIYPADFKIIYTNYRTAEMSKYMMNCFLALKVTFCGEIYKACEKANIEYDDVRNIFIQDSRINPSHTFIYEDKPFYDSHCLNKDIPSFIEQFDLPLMKRVFEITNKYKEDFKNGHK